jgi:hypothetical protein
MDESQGGMIPQTLVSFALFLVLIAPGLVYQMLYERRHPALEETVFREASRTALTSVVFSALACLILSLVRIGRPGWMVDLGAYLRDGKNYYGQHYNLVIQTVALEVLLAIALVGLYHWIPLWLAKYVPAGWFREHLPEWLCPSGPQGSMSREGIWYKLLRKNEPEGKSTWVSLRLSDGSRVGGYVAYYTSGAKPENREIALEKPSAVGDFDIDDLKLDPSRQNLKRRWAYVVVRGDEITYMKVRYININRSL